MDDSRIPDTVSSATVEGWVWKVKSTREGVMARKVEQRWAVLRGTELLYYADETLAVLKKRVPLRGARVLGAKVKVDAVMEAENPKNPPVVRHFLGQRKYPVVLQFSEEAGGGGRAPLDLVLAFASRSEHEQWVTALKSAASVQPGGGGFGENTCNHFLASGFQRNKSL